ncbi:MAG: hypothetical protein JWN07_1650 [Hyphomicrobiales bacterium]|nr:hypothetical protein [Hyphomicrobiales bacterium]
MLEQNVIAKALPEHLRVAVLVPCYNEALTIGNVVLAFRQALPNASIHVYDNASSDNTAEVAAAAGAIVHHESRRGKGNVVRRMFGDIDADVFVMVDGDDTYEAAKAPLMVQKLVMENLDFVNGSRHTTIEEAYRPGHRFGNWLLTNLVTSIFGRHFTDMLSGYKVLSRRFVKSFPAMSTGFETETEIAVHALELRMPSAEVETEYKDRPPGSTSKLRTYSDGYRILMLILRLVKDERPFQFFGFVGFLAMVAGFVLSIPVIITYIETGLVPRMPTAVLSLGLVLLGVLCFFSGLILDMTTRTRREMKRLVYLATSPRA